ncbi:MAG: class I SAM-dependent methyltransferase, partial [Saprospiraceae bacterium]
ESLSEIPVMYLEFGVSEGYSFRWWANANQHKDSTFFGFDTFEGLPESWGTYGKGDMSAGVPATKDSRSTFIKGLFQDTLFDFIRSHNLTDHRKIIHLDADLFSSTLFVLTSLAPFLSKGDILFFDEFNVPNHEWMAYQIFTDSFYVKTEILGAVNNYYQVAFRIV